MASSFETSDFRKGLKVLYNALPFVIIDFQHVKPGKGNAFTRTKLRNLQTGSVLEVTFKSGERLEDPEVEERTMKFLYAVGDAFHFMDNRDYEQVELTRELLGHRADYLLEDTECDVVFWRGRPVTVEIPQHMELKIAHTEPGVRGDTATNVTKPATLQTGAVVNVPIFINIGDTVKVDTASGQYLERTSIGNG